MKSSTLLLPVLALAVTACSNQSEEPTPPAPDSTSERTQAEPVPTPTTALVSHMHLHAEKFEDLNDALAAGDLDAVYTPAWWLSRHERAHELVPDWGAHLSAMRKAAGEAETATDLATARTAVEDIARACNACHSDANVDKVIYAVDPR